MRGLLFVAPATLLLLIASGFLLLGARHAREPDLGIEFDQPRHVITPQMEVETAAMANRAAPGDHAQTERGKPIEIAPRHGDEPQFVLFIKDGCPCSIDAQPLFNRLAERFDSKVRFIGVIDGDQAHAKNFASQFSCAFPVVADPALTLIRSYHAKAGVYSALVSQRGQIVKMWPGYSASILAEMNRSLAQSCHVKPKYFDPQYAPRQKAAGCAFNWS